ncbi:MAG TPA: hypothetical protein VH280_23360 [Verrucomicrobiae bacterium]|jgi:hypothetical protein|nr:hypothetical protein [Verrucomicrobiae bacterium]
MNTRYLPEVAAINEGISSFNQFLHPSRSVPKFEFDKMTRDNGCVEVIHGDWANFYFPNAEHRGVYFVFAYEKTAQKKTVSILEKHHSGHQSVRERMLIYTRAVRSRFS